MDPQRAEQVEKELLELITERLKEKKIDIQTARKLASDFLKVLPITSQEDLLSKLKELAKTYNEAQELYVVEYGKVIAEKEKHAVHHMGLAIKEGNIEQALSIAKSLKAAE